jgi:galactokinase
MIQPEELVSGFPEVFGSIAQTEAYFSPGRINLIGEHIDYNGGLVMPAAISLGISALFQPDDTNELKVYAADFKELVTIDLSTLPAPVGYARWPLYVAGTMRVMKRKGRKLRGGNLMMKSDLPLASGLSSSAAMECLIAFIMDEQYYKGNRMELALHAQEAEREEVGVNCGIMDQFAVASGKQGMAMLLHCDTLEYEYIPARFEPYVLTIINSNFPRILADSKYNERRSECEQALSIIQKNGDPATFLTEVHEISIAQLTDDIIYARAKHVVTEQQRVIAASDALRSGNVEYFGNLLWASHESLDKDYEVAGDALNTIVHFAGKFSGCIGARMTGAGFGGCAIALVEKGMEKRFSDYVGRKYTQHTGFEATFFPAEISDGIRKLSTFDKS